MKCESTISIVNKLTKFAGLILCLTVVQVAQAQNRASNWTFSGDGEIYGSNAIKNGVHASLYFDPQTYSVGPIAERYFLNPTDTIRLSGYQESISDPVLGYGSDGMDSLFSYSRVAGKHIFTPSVFYTDYESLTTLGAGIRYSYLLGLGAQAFIGAEAGREELASGTSTSSSLDLGYRKLWQYINGKSFAASVQLGYTRSRNESRAFSIFEFDTQLDYYFNSRWSAGIGLRQTASDVPVHQSFGLRLSTEYFFTNWFSANFKVLLEDYLPKSSLLLGFTIYF